MKNSISVETYEVSLHISPDFQGKGLGWATLQAVKQWLVFISANITGVKTCVVLT